VNELMKLYTQAIDFYVSTQDDSYLFFKKKLQALVTDQKCLKAMDKEVINRRDGDHRLPIHTPAKEKTTEPEFESPESVGEKYLKKKNFQEHIGIEGSRNLESLRELVDCHIKCSLTKDSIIDQNLETQMASVKSRLLLRNSKKYAMKQQEAFQNIEKKKSNLEFEK